MTCAITFLSILYEKYVSKTKEIDNNPTPAPEALSAIKSMLKSNPDKKPTMISIGNRSQAKDSSTAVIPTFHQQNSKNNSPSAETIARAPCVTIIRPWASPPPAMPSLISRKTTVVIEKPIATAARPVNKPAVQKSAIKSAASQ